MKIEVDAHMLKEVFSEFLTLREKKRDHFRKPAEARKKADLDRITEREKALENSVRRHFQELIKAIGE
jgi:hypothetical protein